MFAGLQPPLPEYLLASPPVNDFSFVQGGHVSPSISIVVPNYNQGEYLIHALASIFKQDYFPLDVHVVDGGSSDSSIDVIRTFEARLSSWCSEPDAGHYDAVNKGMARATGDILCYLNSDDMLFDGALRCVGEIFENHREVDWLTSLFPAAWDLQGNCIWLTEIPGYSRDAFLDGFYGYGEAGRTWFIQQESTFWTRELWERAEPGIRCHLTHAGDFDLWGRFFEKATLYGVSAPLGGFRIRSGQRGADPLYREQASRRLQEFRQEANWSPSRFRVRSAGLALGLFGLPKIGGALRRAVGYKGKRLVRSNPGLPTARWEIQEYIFP